MTVLPFRAGCCSFVLMMSVGVAAVCCAAAAGPCHLWKGWLQPAARPWRREWLGRQGMLLLRFLLEPAAHNHTGILLSRMLFNSAATSQLLPAPLTLLTSAFVRCRRGGSFAANALLNYW